MDKWDGKDSEKFKWFKEKYGHHDNPDQQFGFGSIDYRPQVGFRFGVLKLELLCFENFPSIILRHVSMPNLIRAMIRYRDHQTYSMVARQVQLLLYYTV